MSLSFFKSITYFVHKWFVLIFTDTDSHSSLTDNMSLSDWRTVSCPKIHNDGTLSVFDYNNKLVRNALYQIKNKNSRRILESMCIVLADILTDELAEREIFQGFIDPIIVSIPTSRKHLVKRGYSPSDVIAKKIGELVSINYLNDIIHKSRNTPDQKTLSRYQRLKNVKNSMSIHKHQIEIIQGRCVIVIDDIMTTGATLKEARRVLLKNGAKKVWGVVLAH